jgi:hypothetical protein
MKKTRGNAYILVVVASLAVLSISLAALTITATSRNITGQYQNFFGLYDLAVAGNEQAFYAIKRGEMEILFVYEPHPYDAVAGGFVRSWQLALNVENSIYEFNASTTVRNRSGGFYIESDVWRYDLVRARVRSVANFLDDYTWEMVELLRITN